MGQEKLEQMRKRQQAEYERVEREINFVASLPDSVQNVKSAYAHDKEIWITYADKLENVIDYMRILAPLNIVIRRGTFTEIQPETLLNPKYSGKIENIAPYLVQVSRWEVSVQWHTYFDGQIVRVEVELTDKEKWAQIHAEYKTEQGEKYITRQHLESRFTGKAVKWSSGSHDAPSSYTIFWARGVEWRNSLDSQIVREKLAYTAPA